jgi:tetratricopeptide (TPR) repeat protein
MRRFLLAAVLISVAFWMGISRRGFAQERNQPAQSGSQDQSSSQDQGSDGSAPQKKAAAKPKNARDSSSQGSPSSTASDSSPDAPQAPSGAPAKDENPFPEAVSRDAARAASADAPPDAPATSPAKAPSASAADNPFPEDVSRSAAKSDADSSAKDPDGQKREGHAKDQGPGASSSRSSEWEENGNSGNSVPQVNAGGKIDKPLAVTDPARAKKDTQVGAFYSQRGDYRGAYLRYKDALGYDPTNVDAVFGLAEAARALKLVPEAERNYELYLEIVPDGAKAKDAAKALHSLDTQR